MRIVRHITWRNFAYSSFALSCLRILVSLWSDVVKVDGSIPGNSFKATGRRNSMKGTRMNTENGTRRNRSDTVRTSCLRKRGKC